MRNESCAISATKQKKLLFSVESYPALYLYLAIQHYCEQNKSLKRIIVFAIVFCLMLINGFARCQEKQNVPSSISFRGAELYADIQEKDKTVIYLKKYYDCGRESVDETEFVSVHEAVTMRIDPPIQLKKQSQEIQENKNLHFGDANTGCVLVITYSAEVDLGERRMDYVITWGHCCFEPTIANLDPVNKQGFALTVHVNNDGNLQKNAMPSLTELPAFVMKQNEDVSGTLKVHDNDQDKITVSISAPTSLVSETPPVGSAGGDYNAPGYSDGRTVITTKPPFKKLTYSKDFNWQNPLNAKLFAIDENTGMFRYKPALMGKYVAAVTIKDTRDGKILSEHQCVFLIDVLP